MPGTLASAYDSCNLQMWNDGCDAFAPAVSPRSMAGIIELIRAPRIGARARRLAIDCPRLAMDCPSIAIDWQNLAIDWQNLAIDWQNLAID